MARPILEDWEREWLRDMLLSVDIDPNKDPEWFKMLCWQCARHLRLGLSYGVVWERILIWFGMLNADGMPFSMNETKGGAS